MKLTETIPTWKMPDQEKIPHIHYIRMRLWANLIENEWIIDLTEYYKWTKENNIEIEHNVLRMGEDRYPSTIMFTFWNSIDSMAFKLRWK